MNYRLVSRVLGLLLLLLSVAMASCLGFAHFEQGVIGASPRVDIRAFEVSILLTMIAAAGLIGFGRRSGSHILRKEAITVVGLGWLLSALFGALPYLFCDPPLPLVSAFFESMSGFTTTGSTVIPDVELYSHSMLLWRALTQWLGGMGILVLFVALLSYLGVGSKALFRHESSAQSENGVQARIHDVALRLWMIYVFFSLLCALGLKALGMGTYDAVTHAFTTISTGGFSTQNQSIASYQNVWMELWLVFFMALGGISFMLHAWLFRGRWDRWAKEDETHLFLGLLLVGTLLIASDLILLDYYPSYSQALRASLFQTVSIMTTTGFATENFDVWPPFATLVLILFMCIGGCAGSTAGGIKVSRWLLFFKMIRTEVIAAFRPNRIMAVHVNGNPADDLLKMQTVFFIALAGVTVFLGTAIVSFFESDLDLISCVSCVMATLFNIGPALGALGPTHTYDILAPATQMFLSFLMMLGRLEFFAVLVLFAPSLWRKY